MSTSLPEIAKREDIAEFAGKTAQILGVYRATNIAKAGSDEPGDHAVIVLSDGARIWVLPPGSEGARRPQDERDEWDGKEIAATGVVLEDVPKEGDGAQLTGPCMITLGGIAPRDLYELTK